MKTTPELTEAKMLELVLALYSEKYGEEATADISSRLDQDIPEAIQEIDQFLEQNLAEILKEAEVYLLEETLGDN